MKHSIMNNRIPQLLALFGLSLSMAVQADSQAYDILIDGEPAKVWASSELESKKDPERYAPQKAFDGDKTTAWAEGNQFGGEGQSIVVEFQKPQMISEIEIANGFQKSSKTYTENNRIDALDIMFDSEPVMLYYLLELEKNSSIQVNRMAKRLTFSIRTVKKGTKYNDLCVSEIALRLVSRKSLTGHSCRHMRSPASASWAFCIDEKNRSHISLGEGRMASLESVIAAEQLTHLSRASDLRIEQLVDFQYGEIFLFKVTAQFDEAREDFLFFVEKSGKPLLAVARKAQRDENRDSFEYIMRKVDLNNDGLPDVRFDGRCSGRCTDFEPGIAYIYRDNSFRKEGAAK